MTLIVQWVSFCLLVGKEAPPISEYRVMPSIVDVQDLLSPMPGSGEIFDIHHENHSIDYEDVGYLVNILGRALSQVDRYTEMDKKAKKAMKDRDEKEHIGLQIVRDMIDVIHGRIGEQTVSPFRRNYLLTRQRLIVDTRAAHLDRSRTKAALQRLSLRIHYQMLAPTANSGKPNTLFAAWGAAASRPRPTPLARGG